MERPEFSGLPLNGKVTYQEVEMRIDCKMKARKRYVPKWKKIKFIKSQLKEDFFSEHLAPISNPRHAPYLKSVAPRPRYIPVMPFVCNRSLVKDNAEMLRLVVKTLLFFAAVCSLAVNRGLTVFGTVDLIAARIYAVY